MEINNPTDFGQCIQYLGSGLLSHSFIGENTRDAAGNQAIVGVGFTPYIVLIMAFKSVVAGKFWSVGYSNSTQNKCMLANYNLEIQSSAGHCIYINTQATSYLRAHVASMDVDGFTLEWDEAGTVPAVIFTYLCIP